MINWRSKLEIVEECWEWRGRVNDKGYGIVDTWDTDTKTASTTTAHRFVYEQVTGVKLPRELEPHHLCDNVSCVNPDHMEICTSEQNRQYQTESRIVCPSGHEYDKVDNRGSRICSKCTSKQKREWKARQRANGLPGVK